ncbi:MAG: 50S ribosomal protein L10 [Phycisphaeraceae bacterium]|nr:50S ribosomal protein L10 [Phycisphaeraceae bacterium]
MSKPIKSLMIKAYRDAFADLDGAVTIDIRGVESNKNNELRNKLAAKGIRVSVVRNGLMVNAMEGTAMDKIGEILDGPTAMCYGAESVVEVARALIDEAKALGGLEFKGAIMEGVVFGADQVKELSKYPTRDEAQAQVIQVILGPGSQIAGALVGVGNEIAGILSAMEEKLEKGEEISKIA